MQTHVKDPVHKYRPTEGFPNIEYAKQQSTNKRSPLNTHIKSNFPHRQLFLRLRPMPPIRRSTIDTSAPVFHPSIVHGAPPIRLLMYGGMLCNIFEIVDTLISNHATPEHEIVFGGCVLHTRTVKMWCPSPRRPRWESRSHHHNTKRKRKRRRPLSSHKFADDILLPSAKRCGHECDAPSNIKIVARWRIRSTADENVSLCTQFTPSSTAYTKIEKSICVCVYGCIECRWCPKRKPRGQTAQKSK